MKARDLIIPLFLGLGGCEQMTSVAPTPLPETNPVYDIYNVVLDSLFLGTVQTHTAPPQFVIIESTNGSASAEAELDGYVADQFVSHKSAFDAAAAALRAAPSAGTMLDATQFRARAPVRLVNPSAVSPEGLGKPRDYWAAFYERYPGARGIIRFEKIAIDPSGKFALLHYGHGCGYLCADYGYILLEKQGSHWIILKRVVYMMS